MNSEYQEQARRLNELRTCAGQGSRIGSPNGSPGSAPNPGENQSWDNEPPNQQWEESQSVNDPLIFQGVYAPSGFDMLDILLAVYNRPNPQIPIGNVDSAVALVLCDAEAPNHPIVYCSEPFEKLTGYSGSEIIGKNCRFLQHPPGGICSDQNILNMNSAARREVKHSIGIGRESRVRVANYKKDGTPFANILTVIPILWEGKHYMVGFQADERSIHR
ncbi:related to vivid PAS protein VVD [Rhynchosporium agropyri]|uniref:Related to vivid PAS protein VVD n=1 Tax=Rhynchosporium agropyri TaxID=914238 RepID=A0A1E1K3I1_9HELO|nr:related to vivid PAS protein VVD [Rhynchosporium agropyri]